MESKAALIPFDRPFKFTVEDLNADYRINLFERIQKENAELLGMFGEEEQEEVKQAEEAAVDEGDNNEDEEDENSDEDSSNSKELVGKKNKKTKNLSKKLSRRAREMEYDYDDPFIDDSEITDVYQSVFELMRGSEMMEFEDEEGEEDEEEAGDKSAKNNKISNRKRSVPNNFFVYRGSMSAEILAKEFEIDAEELLEREDNGRSDSAEGGEGQSEEEDSMSDSAEVSKEHRKRSNNSTAGSSGKGAKRARMSKKAAQVPKKQKPATKVVKLKEPKPPKSQKATDLISQSAKKFGNLFSSTDEGEKEKPVAEVPVFNVIGVDGSVLELREVLKRFRDASVGTTFSPGKFPSVLRPRLNETICAVLRVMKPSSSSSSSSAPFPEKFLPALASFLPFSASALNRLLTKKILGPLLESIEATELPKMYSEWSAVLVKRVQEGGIVETIENTLTEHVSNVSNVPIVINEGTSVNPSTSEIPTINSASPVKKRLKFNDEMRQLVFEIIRAEIDLNNLVQLNNLVSVEAASAEEIGTPKRTVQSELTLRKNVYQKLSNLSSGLDASSSPTSTTTQNNSLLSTTEISKEFSAQKRKHEKRIAKLAGEILFGEAAVEDLLKSLHESTIVTKTTNTNNNNNNTTNTNTNNTVNNQNVDPLNLFTNDQTVNADTSVIMEKQSE